MPMTVCRSGKDSERSDTKSWEQEKSEKQSFNYPPRLCDCDMPVHSRALPSLYKIAFMQKNKSFSSSTVIYFIFIAHCT